MTLSGVAADDATWDLIESGWQHILGNRIPKAAYMHMKEAMPLRGEFDASKGWDDGKVDSLLSDLLVHLSAVDRNNYHQFACTIDMDAYRKLVIEGYSMDDPIAICNESVAKRVMYWFHFVRRGIDLTAAYYFDRGEPFEPEFKRRWELELEIDGLSGDDSVWSHIACVCSADMKTIPGLQVADMLAWGLNRQSVNSSPRGRHLATAMANFMPCKLVTWTEDALRKKYGRIIAR